MPNGTFKPGAWVQLPTNCTRDYTLTVTRCAEYGMAMITECVSWISNVVQTCLSWAWTTASTCIAFGAVCCSWWPCSWACAVIVDVVCVLFAIIVSLVCLVFALIVVVVCAVLLMIEVIFCMLWSVIEIIFCMSTANGGTAFLLTDGTIMVQELKSFAFGAVWPTHRWWKLTPDQFGIYANGRWSPLANSIVGRRDFASGVLADGRVLLCGGEWTDVLNASGNPQEDNTCEIYDPVADTWTLAPQPSDPTKPGAVWDQIGDSPCAVLPDGTFLLGSNAHVFVSKFDPVKKTWTSMASRPDGTSAEESWVLMPNQTIATISCTGTAIPNSAPWVYDIVNDFWSAGNTANATIKTLPQTVILGPADNSFFPEIGPALLLYDGTALFIGANQHTAKFSTGASPQWANGLDLPSVGGNTLGVVDGPGAMLVSGNVFFGAGPIDAAADNLGPVTYFEFDGMTYNITSSPPGIRGATDTTHLLVLPDASVMLCTDTDSIFLAYQPVATPQDSFRPVIQTCPTTIAPGTTIQISGFQFNGLSQASAYGDDSQTATNYPLVRITNQQTNHVRYCRTHDHTTTDGTGKTVSCMGVATGMSTVVTTNVDIPSDMETGNAKVEVVANGIASLPFNVTITPVGF